MKRNRIYLQRRDVNLNRGLEEFGGWAQVSPEADFFNESMVEDENKGTDAKSVLEQVSKDDLVNEDEKKNEKVEDKEEDFFGGEPAKVENKNDNKDKEDEDNDDFTETPNTFILNTLKEKGFIDFELKEGEELTEELAEELLEEKFDESVDNKVSELMAELPDDSKEVIQFLIKGGKLTDLVGAMSTSENIDINADIEKESNHETLMKKLLKLEDKDEEEIEAEIEYLKDSGKLKSILEKKFNKYKKEVEERQNDIIKGQEAAKLKEKEDIKKYKTKVATFLTENEDVNGMTFSKEDKKQLPSFMNDKTFKLNNGTLITEMQKILFYDIPGNEKANVQLATLLRNRNQDGTFNFDKIEKDTKTRLAKDIKNSLRRDKSSIPENSKQKQVRTSTKSLADFFEK